jgi:3-dehydroshikimate dehydratase
MSVGFCTIAYRLQRLSLPEIIWRIADHGYDEVEIWGAHLDRLESLWEIRHCLDATGLGVSLISPYLDFTGAPRLWKKSLASAERYLDHASELGASGIRVFTGQKGSCSASYEQWRDCLTALRALADMAAGRGLQLYIETHPNTLADTAGAIKKLLDGIKRTNVGLILDPYNLYEVEGDGVYESVRQLMPTVRHIHLKNADTGGLFPSPFPFVHQKRTDLSKVSYLARGDLDYERLFEIFFESGFSGRYSVEWFGDDVEGAASRERGYLADILKGRAVNA